MPDWKIKQYRDYIAKNDYGFDRLKALIESELNK